MCRRLAASAPRRGCRFMLLLSLYSSGLVLPSRQCVPRVGSAVSMCTQPEPTQLKELVSRIAQLDRECPWTKEQTPTSILSYLLEELTEVEVALDTGAPRSELASELGDLLFNTLLAIQLCSRDRLTGVDGEPISLESVAGASLAKLRRRYAPLFDNSLGGLSMEDANRAWAAGKAAEAAEAEEAEEAAAEAPAAAEESSDDFDAAMAAEIAELDRLEAKEEEMEERQRLARLVMEQIAREAQE